MKIPTFIYRCNICNYDTGLVFHEKREIHGFHFHRISSINPEEEHYSVLKMEKKKADYHICAICLEKLQERDKEIGLNRPLNKAQVEQLIGKKL